MRQEGLLTHNSHQLHVNGRPLGSGEEWDGQRTYCWWPDPDPDHRQNSCLQAERSGMPNLTAGQNRHEVRPIVFILVSAARCDIFHRLATVLAILTRDDAG